MNIDKIKHEVKIRRSTMMTINNPNLKLFYIYFYAALYFINVILYRVYSFNRFALASFIERLMCNPKTEFHRNR